MMSITDTAEDGCARVIVCGGRDLDAGLVEGKFFEIASRFDWEQVVVISGCAEGADAGGALAARRVLQWSLLEFPADWKSHARAAGPIRNQQMLDEGRPNVVIAFWDGKSRGTRDMIMRAAAAGIPIIIEPAGKYKKEPES